MALTTIEEGLALHRLGLLRVEEIPVLAMLFLAQDCDVPEMAALAGSLPIEHPADTRSDLERALQLAGRPPPSRLEAARTLKKLYALRGSSGELPLCEAARLIKDTFREVELELPSATETFLGDSFGIAALLGIYYSYDDISFDDLEAREHLDRELHGELLRLARTGDE